MNCPRCGFTFSPNMNFCPNCGLQIKKVPNNYANKGSSSPQQRPNNMPQRNNNQNQNNSYDNTYTFQRHPRQDNLASNNLPPEYSMYQESDSIDRRSYGGQNRQQPNMSRIKEYTLDTSYYDEYDDIPSRQMPSTGQYFPRTTSVHYVPPKPSSPSNNQNSYRATSQQPYKYEPRDSYSPYDSEQPRKPQPQQRQQYQNSKPPQDDWLRQREMQREMQRNDASIPLRGQYNPGSPSTASYPRSSSSGSSSGVTKKTDDITDTTTLPPRFRRKAESSQLSSGNYNSDDYYDDQDDDGSYGEKKIYTRPWFILLISLIVIAAFCIALQMSGTIDFKEKFSNIFDGDTNSSRPTEQIPNGQSSEKDGENFVPTDPQQSIGDEADATPAVVSSKLEGIAEDQMLKLGDLMKTPKYNVMIKSAEPTEGTDVDVADEGKQFYLAEVFLENTSSEGGLINPYNFIMVSVKDGEETLCDPITTDIDTETALKRGELSPGSEAEGTVVFMVDTSADNVYIIFEPDNPPNIRIVYKVK